MEDVASFHSNVIYVNMSLIYYLKNELIHKHFKFSHFQFPILWTFIGITHIDKSSLGSLTIFESIKETKNLKSDALKNAATPDSQSSQARGNLFLGCQDSLLFK